MQSDRLTRLSDRFDAWIDACLPCAMAGLVGLILAIWALVAVAAIAWEVPLP